MTNGEKYKTAKEQTDAFYKFCDDNECIKCPCRDNKISRILCAFNWLKLEYKEELLPCPFCGGRAEFNKTLVEDSTYGWVQCTYCGAHFITKDRDEAISAWNRRAK
jgi:Lar family restriction alleviation protein